MDTTSSTVLTAGVVALGHWSEGKMLPIKFYAGVAVLAVGLAAMGEANAQFAEQFGLLILIGALLIYAAPLAKKLGWTK